MKTNIKFEIIKTAIVLVVFAYFSGKIIGKALYHLTN
ncbi:Uncharacterised protein [Elizabethkingia anophelis]|uniref:Uncharacterized protein n=1 Tax=Elizabethkingia anophelis TaxID=1117645 RepID=A0A7Z7LW95_9FLAO|nr:Uncharacterised protein [Elizabethkingia anophelis]STD00567.1 Uncharacterised protein [Elizabethkingia anophelis]